MMTKAAIEKIIDDLSKVDQIIRNYRETGVLHNIEKDIILTKLRLVYDSILLEQSQPSKSPDESSLEKGIASPAPVIEATSLTKEYVLDEKISETPEAVKIESDHKNVKTIETIISDTNTKTKVTTQQAVKTEILAEKFEQKNFLNEALAQYKNMFDIVKKMQNQPLHNIFSAINLNDRFLFINELFNNDDSLYQKTIEKLNVFNTFNEAIQYLDQNFKWDFDDVQVQKLLELVHRRFLPGNNESKN